MELGILVLSPEFSKRGVTVHGYKNCIDMILSPAKKYIFNKQIKRLVQHVQSPKLIVRRLKSPRKAFFLFWAPFFDKNYSRNTPQKINSILANSLRSFVLVSNTIPKAVPIETFKNELATNYKLSTNNSEILGTLFKKYGSDKAKHGYHIFYDAIINLLLIQNKNSVRILEIGLGTNNLNIPSNMGSYGKPGASLRAFRDFSDRIKLVGGDIDKRILFEENGIQTCFVDQLRKESLINLKGHVLVSDLIIDDGLHTPEANLNVIVAFKDYMKIGSWIVIEDIDKTEFNLNLWTTVKDLMPDFESHVIDAPNVYVFIARKMIQTEF